MATTSDEYSDLGEDLSVTLTVAIALDDEQPPPASHNNASSDILDPALEISAPISAVDACPIPELQIMTKHLPPEARKMLCLRLNPPAFGSMKNWEYIGCIVGLTSDEIADYQRSSNPMNFLLNHLGEQPLQTLIIAIGQCKRIDVLITLSKYISSISASPAVANQGAPESNTDSAVYSFPSRVHNIPKVPEPPENFILLTHHINKSHPDQKTMYKCFKWMEKNLKAQLNGLEIVNIHDIENESDFFGTVDRFFHKAKHIVLFATPQYNIDIANPALHSEDGFIKMKRFLHRLMESEYHNNNFQNFRFRVVKPDMASDDCIPSGWPRNTVVYKFPSGWVKLFERLSK